MTFYLTYKNDFFAMTEENGQAWLEKWNGNSWEPHRTHPPSFRVLTYAEIPTKIQLNSEFLADLLSVTQFADVIHLSLIAAIINAYLTGTRWIGGSLTEYLAINVTAEILQTTVKNKTAALAA